MSDEIESVKGLRIGMIIRCLDNSPKSGMLPTHLTQGNFYEISDITTNSNSICKVLIWVNNDNGYLDSYNPDRFDSLCEVRDRLIEDILS